VFALVVYPTSGALSGVTDSNSDNFTLIGSEINLNSGTYYARFAWFPKLTTTISTVTANFSSGVGFPVLYVSVADDSGASPAVDGTPCSNYVFTATSAPCSSALTLAATDYVFAEANTTSGGTTLSAGSGFTLGPAQSSNASAEYGLFSGSVTPSFTMSPADSSGIEGAAFKP
jgi:hypothetical protein